MPGDEDVRARIDELSEELAAGHSDAAGRLIDIGRKLGRAELARELGVQVEAAPQPEPPRRPHLKLIKGGLGAVGAVVLWVACRGWKQSAAAAALAASTATAGALYMVAPAVLGIEQTAPASPAQYPTPSGPHRRPGPSASPGRHLRAAVSPPGLPSGLPSGSPSAPLSGSPASPVPAGSPEAAARAGAVSPASSASSPGSDGSPGVVGSPSPAPVQATTPDYGVNDDDSQNVTQRGTPPASRPAPSPKPSHGGSPAGSPQGTPAAVSQSGNQGIIGGLVSLVTSVLS